MKKALGKMKRTISVLLAAAMILTALPQTSAFAYASEVQDVLNEGGEAAEIVGEDKENGDTGNSSADSDGNPDSGKVETEAPDQSEPEESDAMDQTDAEEKENSDGTGSGETEVTDQNDPDGTDDSEEDSDQTVSDETLSGNDTDADEPLTDDMEELDETTIRVFETGENVDDNPQAETINVNITLPYYRDENYDWTPFLAELSYAVGDETDFKPVDLEGKKVSYLGKYTVSVPVEVDKDFKFKLSCKDNMRLKDVTLKSNYGGNNYSNPATLTAENDVYTITVNKQDENSWYNVESYEIDITALQIWTITFVDLYARNNENTASVEIYQAKRNNEGQIEESSDIAGQTITVDSEEWENCYYKVNAKENFTFDSMAASASGITIKKTRINGETAYQFEKNARVPKDITIFVTAEETQQKTLTLNMPSEVTNAMQVAVYGKTPSDTGYSQLELNGGTVTVRDDMAVYVKVTSNNMAYMVQATYQETGEEPEPFAESDVHASVADGGWTREYTLGALNHVKDGITINLSRAKVNQVRMAVNWGAVSEISVDAPVSGYYYPGDADSGDEGSGNGVTTYVPEGETLKFYVVMENGKGAACVSTEDGKEIGIDHESTYWGTVTSYYNIVPTSDMNISVKGREYEYRFDYSEEDVSILVYETEGSDNGPTGDPLELTDHCYRTYNKSSYLWVMVKPNINKELSVWYNNGGDRTDVERGEWYDRMEEDGSKYLCYGPISEYWAMDNTITIEGHSINTVTFETENNLSFYKVTYDGDWFNEEDRIDGSITVREGEDLYFKVKGYNSDTQRLLIGMTGTDRESLETLQDNDDYSYPVVYHLVPAADTTITFTTEERKQCEVVIEKSDNVKSFYADYDGDEDGMGISAAGTYKIREDGYITISGIIATGSEAEAAAKKGKVIYRIGEESYEVLPEYNLDAQESFYRIKVTDDMKISIDVQDIAQYTISFKDFGQLENIRVWESGTDKEKDNLYKTNDGIVTLDDNGYYYFDFQLKDGVGLDAVTLKDGTGNEKILARTYIEEDEEMGYRIGALRGNTEIVPELVSGYTVKFDLSKLSAEDAAAIKIYDSYAENELIIGQEEGRDTGSRKLSFAATENGLFYFSNWRYYKLTPDSESFTITKGQDNDGWDVFVINPKQNATLPEVVTISLEKYEEHNVTLDYSDEIRSISLQNIYGGKFASVENQTEVYKVYGEGAVLRVKAIDGYSPVVKIKGTTEGAEAAELTPYRFDSEGAAEYYLEEFTEDKIIQVTVARTTQRKIYKVGFLSEGGYVTVRDSAYGTLYDVNNYQDEYSADYSVLKGDKISFCVELALGYELNGVYANGQEIQPVRDPLSQRDVYEVTPVADTQIRIDVSWIVPKYPLMFSWTNTDAIKSVKVQGYELQDNRIDVTAGAKVSFSVELTDTKYSVTSVTMNGQEVPYSAGTGLYTLTALYEPMNVEINADVADKIIKFSNTLENAQYEVETNELIRHRNGDTYLASGNAELLKFKVNVSDKTQKIGVAYINQKGVKSVLKEKGQADQGEQGLSYSYEIAVADLPLNSEITISGEIPSGDKTALETAVTQYERYKKSDYTEESWTVFEGALKEAQACMKKEDATQEEIDAVLGRLQKAAAALVKKEDDPNPPTPEHHEGLWFEILENEETADGSYIYTGAAIKPDIKVYNGDTLLEVKKDYTVAYKQNINAGTATITVTGKGNFKSKATATFTINKKDISDGDISAADVYAIMKANGTVANPKVAVKFGKKTLKLNNDYKVIWPEDSEIKDTDGKAKAGVYNVTISTTAVKKVSGTDVDSTNYKGSRTIAYTVLANDAKLMSKATITLTAKNVDYADRNDPAKRPQVKTVKISGKEVPLKEFIITDTGYEQAGKATITVTGKDQAKYYGSKSVTYDVKGTKLSAAGFAIGKIDSQDYTGAPIYINQEAEEASMRKLEVKPKNGAAALTEGTDYTVSYATGKKVGEHTNVGTVTVTITGMGAYTGSMKTTFKITPVDLGTIGSNQKLVFEASGAAKYTKTGAKPEITTLTFNGAELVEKKDYTISYQKNSKVTNGATATMTIKGKGNFKGKHVHEYAVTGASKDDVYATATDIVKPAKINQVKSTVKVFEASTGKVLKAGTDYEKAIKYYSDEACTKEITADNFDKPIAENSAQTPTDFDAEIYAKIIMKGNYAGTAETPGFVTTKFRVYNKDLKMTSKKLVITVDTTHDKNGKDIVCDGTKSKNPYYTGAYIEPKVTVTVKGSDPLVTLVEGEDYEVKYANHKNRGKATITVTGIGNGYGGTKSVKFTIVAKDMKWAEQTVKRAAEVLSGLVPVTE